MNLGQFSISLAVKDIAASRSFYEKLGFSVYDGNQAEGWLILKNGETYVGIFQGMFEGAMLTFHPKDARAVQAVLDRENIAVDERTKGDSGPTHISLRDPDGYPILIDQFDADYKPNPKTID